MQMVKDPRQFDVIVTNNMFGDIVTDLGAALQGGLGMAASGNIHPGRISMFEPVHGSAPKYAGTGKANPFGRDPHGGPAARPPRRRRRRRPRSRPPWRPACATGRRPPTWAARLSTSQAGDAVCQRLRFD